MLFKVYFQDCDIMAYPWHKPPKSDMWGSDSYQPIDTQCTFCSSYAGTAVLCCSVPFKDMRLAPILGTASTKCMELCLVHNEGYMGAYWSITVCLISKSVGVLDYHRSYIDG